MRCTNELLLYGLIKIVYVLPENFPTLSVTTVETPPTSTSTNPTNTYDPDPGTTMHNDPSITHRIPVAPTFINHLWNVLSPSESYPWLAK